MAVSKKESVSLFTTLHCTHAFKKKQRKMFHAPSTMHNRIGLIRTRNKRERKSCKRGVREEYTDDSVMQKTQI